MRGQINALHVADGFSLPKKDGSRRPTIWIGTFGRISGELKLKIVVITGVGMSTSL